MKLLKKPLLVPALAVVALFVSCEKETVLNIDPQIAGTWKLEAITYGLSQTTVRGEQLPYSEKIEFSGTNYTVTRDGKVESTGRYYTGKDEDGVPFKKAVFYPDDNTHQGYETTEGRLYLYERGAKADGSFYEYKRQ